MHPEAQIDAYLSEGVPGSVEAKLRNHMRTCRRCRGYYHEQVLLLRALSGDPGTPTCREDDRMVGLALRAAGLAPPERAGARSRSILDRVLYASTPALASAAAFLLVLVTCVLWLLIRPAGPVFAASLIRGKQATIDGVPADTRLFDRIPLRGGERLEVGAAGFAELSLERGGSLRVFPGAVLSLAGPGERVDLERGKVWCIVELSEGPFAVYTDLAEVRTVGTSFVVERRKSGETEVRVVQGAVEVRKVAGEKAVRIKGCNQMRVTRDQPPGQSGRYNPKPDRTEWEQIQRHD